MRFIHVLALFLFSIFISCKEHMVNPSVDKAKYQIDVDGLKKEDYIPISSYFTSVRPIVLETSESCLIKSIDAVQTTDDYIFILDRSYRRLYCFDKIGKFVRKIGELGTGPEEFISISDFAIDGEFIYILDRHGFKISSYTLSGEYISSIDLKSIEGNAGHMQTMGEFIYLDFQPDEITVDAETPLLIKIDKVSGEVVNKYLSANQYNLGFQLIIFKRGSYFYSNSTELYYAPIYSNTVFSLSNDIEPYFQINRENVLQKSDLKELDLSNPNVIVEIDAFNKLKSILNFFEIGDYIICEYNDGYGFDLMMYSKKDNSASLYEGVWDDYIYKSIDKSLPHYFVCSDKNGLYAYMTGDDIPFFVELYNSEDLKLSFDTSQHEVFQSLTEDSNPILFYYELGD